MTGALLALLTAAAPALGQQQPPPGFRSGVDLVPIDVTVVDGRGQPIDALAPGDFSVRVDDQPRQVLSAEWIPRLTAARGGAVGTTPPPAGDGYFSNASAGGSGLVVIAIDEANIKFGGMRPVLPAVSRFIDRLPAADRVAIVSLGRGTSSWSDFTADRDVIKEKLAQMPGQITAPENPWNYRVGIGAALAHYRGDPEALEPVIRRACAGTQVQRNAGDCPLQVRLEATSVANLALRNANFTINGLRDVLTVLKPVDAPKTLLLISDGFGLDRSEMQRRVEQLGDLAAAARTTIYGLKLEEESTNITETVLRSPFELQQDQVERRQGLELLAYAARGGLFTLSGTGTGAFDRIETEMSGYYLLGVESTARDREGDPLALHVAVARPDVTVRARRAMAVDPRASPRTAHDRANAALANPLMLSAVPLRGTAVALRGPDRAKVQVVVHADIDAVRTDPRVISIAYVILDAEKRAVEGQISDVQAGSAANGSRIQYSRTAMVPPGNYTVRIAVVDGELSGSVEFPLRADVPRAGNLEVTELVVGGPEPLGNPSQPTFGQEVRFGLVQGYFEAYGPEASGLTATLDVVTADDAAAVLSASIPGRQGGAERFIFSRTMPVGELPPGIYRLRSTLNSATPVVRSRPFEVIAPPPPPDGMLFLTVSGADLGRPFDLEAALQPAVVQPLRARLPAEATSAFDAALAELRNRAYVAAASGLEDVVETGAGGAALAYLGNCFAAAGRDDQALAMWRKALAGGADLAVVHAWMIDAFLRTKRYGEARAATEAAVARWPADVQFARPLAILSATAGSARDAMLALDRYLEQREDDQASLFLALAWMVEARRAGLDAGNVTRARVYAARYAALSGPRQPLVRLWMDYLER